MPDYAARARASWTIIRHASLRDPARPFRGYSRSARTTATRGQYSDFRDRRRVPHIFGSFTIVTYGKDSGKQSLRSRQLDIEAAIRPPPFVRSSTGPPDIRSEERRVGKERVSTCRSWGAPDH